MADRAEKIAAANGEAAALLRRNGKPIGIAVILAAADEAQLAEWVGLSWASAMREWLDRGWGFRPISGAEPSPRRPS